MNRFLKRLSTAFSTVRQVGLARSFWYAVYQTGLRSGHYRRSQSTWQGRHPIGRLRSPYTLPATETLQAVIGDGLPDLIAEANEIAAGQARLFGGLPTPLNLALPDTGHHWTYYEGRPHTWGVEDLKLIWEPARFGWVYPLGRAYRITGSETYPRAFWEHLETFLAANLPNQGPNWLSAQEVGLRLLALLFAARVFEEAEASTLARMERLARAIADHAARIPLTLSYARAQNNNHRITEALALYAAGWALPDHPRAQKWQRTGWRELNQALLSQIEPDGVYTQHSMNYHRLMLQAALQAPLFGRSYPDEIQKRLAAATGWLLAQVDALSGHAPNLGSNDGALIFPLASGRFADYRPTAQAAASAFLQQSAFLPGPWDEMCLWLGLPVENANRSFDGANTENLPDFHSPAVYKSGEPETWATLRAARFRARPSHADQLHVDLWWRGENIALDAGTYRYTAPTPWNNTLAQTRVHNTVEVNQLDQMRRAGRFLWLDWAQAELLPQDEKEPASLAAQHDGYRRFGVLHRRTLEYPERMRWRIIDVLLPVRKANTHQEFDLRLHWLLPDWPWQIEKNTLELKRPGGGSLRLTITAPVEDRQAPLTLVRAGEILTGPEIIDPILGWYSPTYNYKVPALSLVTAVCAPLPYSFISEWLLEADEPVSG